MQKLMIDDVVKYWQKRAEVFSNINDHKAGVYIDFNKTTYRIWSFVQNTALSRHIKAFKSKVILDYGCGNGRWVLKCDSLGAKEIVGFDPAIKMVEIAYLKTNNFSNIVITNEVENIADKYFDIITSLNVLHVINDNNILCNAIEIMHSKLKDNGIMSVIVHTKYSHFIKGYSKDNWCRIIESKGFKMVKESVAEYSIFVNIYRHILYFLRKFILKEKENYEQGLVSYEKNKGFLIKIHEIIIMILFLLGLPIEIFVVGRKLPPFSELLILTFCKK